MRPFHRHQLLPQAVRQACRRWDIAPSRWCLVACVQTQTMDLWEASPGGNSGTTAHYGIRRHRFLISTSRHGIGELKNSFRTPLGLHRICRKIGGGYPVGAVFKHRQFMGFSWRGIGDGMILHRILWLEGLEPGRNCGGDVDSRERYIYIHGYGNELTLGRPSSQGCIHLAARDLLPLYDLLPEGSLVYITATLAD